ncbi:MAG: hypothetical protein JWN30_1980 [Bacilli bacterium]|nr:hypothetical protein [Bacilli bacterium]
MDRIALITYHAPPLLSAESILVGKAVHRLADLMKIDLITARDDPDFREDEALERLISHPNITRFSYPVHRPSNKIIRRMMDRSSSKLGREIHQSWMKLVLSKHDWNREYQLIYSRSQPGASHLVALEVKYRLEIPWVASFSDPWAYNPYHLGNTNVRRQEKTVVQGADALIFPTAEILKLMTTHYEHLKLEEKAHIIPHCFDAELYPEQTDRTAGGRTDDKLIKIAYIGDFYGLRSPKPLCDALLEIEHRAPEIAQTICLQIVGNVESKFTPLLQQFRGAWSGQLDLVGQVPYLQSLDYMSSAAILVLVDAPGTVNLFLPSKLIDYFGAKRPIVGITPLAGTTANLLQDYQHQVKAPEDVMGITDALLQVVANYSEEQRRVEGLDYDRFTAREIADNLHELFTQLIQH